MSGVLSRTDVADFRRRLRWLMLICLLAFGLLAARMVKLQWVDHAYYRSLARENIARRMPLPTTRGIIRDRYGAVLAGHKPSFHLFVVPEYLDLNAVWPQALDIAGVPEGERATLTEWVAGIKNSDSPRRRHRILVRENISRDAVAQFSTLSAEMPGIAVVPQTVRDYPLGEAAAHVVGYVAEIDAERLATLSEEGYTEGDRLGATGVERAFEDTLRGSRGWEKVLVDARGKRREGGTEFLEPPLRLEPVPGRDLTLTIDAELQLRMQRAMQGELAGGAVVVDVRNGQVLGLYSKPSFDPNVLSGAAGKEAIREAFRKLYADPLKPMLDKTVAGSYPPASTLKPFAAIAALEASLVKPSDTAACRGYLRFGRRLFRCTHVHDRVNLHEALAESCNVYFFRLVADEGLSMDGIARVAARFGLGERTGIGINAEVAGRVPTRSWMTMHNQGRYELGFGLNAAIGQGATTVTVLQLAMAYAALANGGNVFEPSLELVPSEGVGRRVVRHVDLNPEHLALVTKALIAGVNEEGGTAYEARAEGVDLAGKTGTAQVSRLNASGEGSGSGWYFNRDHAWFAGFSPAKAPEIAVVVLVEHGGAGGKHAAPIAVEITRAYHELKSRERSQP